MATETVSAIPVVAKGRWYPHYVLGVLALATALNNIDRGIVAVLLEPIKAEFQASDTAMGLLTGIVFVALYSLSGVPVARLADRSVRRTVLAIGVAFWSLMTAFCGLASSFLMLAIGRAGVGIGEAAGPPSSMALISDYFRPRERARALSIFQSAGFVGTMVGLPTVGFLADNCGWRAAFLVVGLAGLPLALLVRTTVREPERGAVDEAGPVVDKPRGTLLAACAKLFSSRVYRCIFIGMALDALAGGSYGAFAAAMLMRTHHLTLTQLASIVGPVIGAGGFVGTILGGVVVPWIVKRTGNDRWSLLAPVICSMIAVPFQLMFVLSGNLLFAVIGGTMFSIMAAIKYGPILALALSHSPAETRSVAAAFILLAINLIGSGMGPVLVGALSDYLRPIVGADVSLNYAILVAPLGMFIGALVFLTALPGMAKVRVAAT